jgi:hypothetical protein
MGMKKRLVQGLLLAGLMVLLLAGCAFAPSSILGTWLHWTGNESVEFTLTKYTLTDLTGGGGTWVCSLKNVDTGNQQIKMTTTSTSGSLDGFSTDGEVWYLLYDVVADTMHLGLSTVTYPTTTPYGEYYKQ